ncbi:uncharacterized protein [Panulirus ornatus]|uniref:uncharacterized protein n=1 Tax=Panulirus ornatus TaxID=150431 RepID=UPI003A88F041
MPGVVSIIQRLAGWPERPPPGAARDPRSSSEEGPLAPGSRMVLRSRWTTQGRRPWALLPILLAAVFLLSSFWPCLGEPSIFRNRYNNQESESDVAPKTDVMDSLNVGIIMPMTNLRLRTYQGRIRMGLKTFGNHLLKYRFGYAEFIQTQLKINPSPTSKCLGVLAHP